MKAVLTAFAISLGANAGLALAADAGCEETFRQLLRGGSGDYPNTSRSVTEMNGVSMKSTFVAQDANTFLTIDETSKSWVVLRDNVGWVSTDEGKSWKKAYELDLAQQEKQKANLKLRAEQATNITCTNGVAFQGGTYRRLSGDWKAVDGSGLVGRNDFYLNEDGSWQASVSDMVMNGNPTKITQVRVPKGEELTVPEVK